MNGLDLLGTEVLGADWTEAPSLADVRASKKGIRKGNRGDSVKYVQAQLNVKPADGLFGDKTEEAVKKFQRANEMDDDGVVGPLTLQAIDGQMVIPEKMNTPSPTKVTAAPQATPTLITTPTKSNWALYAAIALGAVAAGGVIYSVATD